MGAASAQRTRASANSRWYCHRNGRGRRPDRIRRFSGASNLRQTPNLAARLQSIAEPNKYFCCFLCGLEADARHFEASKKNSIQLSMPKCCDRRNVRVQIFDPRGHLPQMEYPARFNQAALDFWDEVERPLPRSFHGFSPTADFWQPKISCLWQPRIRITMLSPTTFLFRLWGDENEKVVFGLGCFSHNWRQWPKTAPVS